MRYRQITAICLILTICIFTSAFYLPSAATGAANAATIPPATEPTKTDQTQTDATTAPTDSTTPVDPTEGTKPQEDIRIPPCPVTEQEIIMLAQTMYAEAQVLCWSGERWGVSYKARQAAVTWTALNQYDDESGEFPDTLADILSYPNAFAYREDAPVTEELLDLARDVVERWWAEKQGVQNVGRTLPADYLFFHGDGSENYFRKEFKGDGSYYDWSLPDPYAEK